MALPTKAQVDAALRGLAEAAESYSDAPDFAGYASRVDVIARAKSLIRAVVSPDMTPNYHGLNIAELIAIRTFMKLKVLDAIPREGSISLQDLSNATGVQDSLLVASGFLDQTRHDGGDYMHTKFSRAYLLDEPGPGHLFLSMYDEWLKKMHNFDDYLAEKGQLQHAREPDDSLYNPYTFSHKQEGTPVWVIMNQDPARLQNFQTSMAGIDLAVPVIGHFDFSSLRNTPGEASERRIQLVDVGGGHGAVLKKILDAHEDALAPATCVLEDRPEVIQLSRTNGILPDDVQRLEHDFMTEQPVKGAKAYFMRMVLHDYADAVGVQILTRLAVAMAPDSRLLVCEMVISSRVNEADFPAAVMDQAVMTMGGKERTEEGFANMFEAAGLELVRVWRVPGVPGGCVEGRLKQ
ncbi:Sterigmatocystin 8-O-methyltransferase [Tolypocladium ophioglossoides CBS 100239]|uniref:Sterigmatocystin 8-O-methyltransferase n=1 Tax=Tolypocladium ophioglossoides (strain CBS 100239) TaxID=1163406 RepID=A0A0L0N381_TOLOC|nr:Sterigmatocystin 8-O-methyltransferase [Tolypocladium ophioglossoides CBS 100239]